MPLGFRRSRERVSGIGEPIQAPNFGLGGFGGTGDLIIFSLFMLVGFLPKGSMWFWGLRRLWWHRRIYYCARFFVPHLRPPEVVAIAESAFLSAKFDFIF